MRGFKLLLEFLNLRLYYSPAVGLVGIRAVVILVIVLRRVELSQRQNLRDDGPGEMFLRLGFYFSATAFCASLL